MRGAKSTKKRIANTRSLRHRRVFFSAAFFYSLHVLCLLSTLVCLGFYVAHPQPKLAQWFAASLVLTGATWILAFFKRRAAVCPLCKGTPLLNSGALTHTKAFRAPPLNHGVTALASIMMTQKFCCMYCGSAFDLLKQPYHIRHRLQHEAEAAYYETDDDNKG